MLDFKEHLFLLANIFCIVNNQYCDSYNLSAKNSLKTNTTDCQSVVPVDVTVKLLAIHSFLLLRNCLLSYRQYVA